MHSLWTDEFPPTAVAPHLSRETRRPFAGWRLIQTLLKGSAIHECRNRNARLNGDTGDPDWRPGLRQLYSNCTTAPLVRCISSFQAMKKAEEDRHDSKNVLFFHVLSLIKPPRENNLAIEGGAPLHKHRGIIKRKLVIGRMYIHKPAISRLVSSLLCYRV